nr:hypothetical protein BaRGS_011066 [Batillaria attramentaria]
MKLLRQRFICSVNNEAVLKALFKVKDTELDFAKAVKIAIETEDAAKGWTFQSQSRITQFTMELDTATTEILFLCQSGNNWGKPKLDDVTHRYESASKHDQPVLGTFKGQTKDPVTDLFKEELGCLKDFELEVKFKSDAKPVFHKARPVPFALRDDLTKGYEEGIAKGVWKPVQFNDYGTPVELMQKLGGGFGYTKIDLADAYNQIKLAPESQRRLALSTHRGFDYTIEYRKTADHGNADALSRLPSGDDIDFDREESGDDTDMVCTIRVLSLQVKPFDSNILRQESGKDPVIATVMRYVREGWPLKHAEINEEVRKFQKLSDSLSIYHGCLIYGTRVVIPQSLQPKILDLLHIGHFGMERMKQLARTAVYWPGIDAAIEMTSRRCDSCGEHQNKPSKPPVHPWMLPEKPWSRVHVDHAINFMGTNWLVITDAYSKYPCIHPTSSTSTRATLDLLEEDFAHFGYPHTLVSDNATTFVSEEFQSWCKERGITHPDRSALSSCYQWSCRTAGADFQASSQEVFSAPEASTSRVSDAVPENANILRILSE